MTDPNIIGAGRENVLSAVNAVVALDPVSISFGSVPSGSGQTRSFTLTLTNVSGAAKTFAVSVDASSGTRVTYSISAPSSISLAAGASGTVTVVMTAIKGASLGDHWPCLRLHPAVSRLRMQPFTPSLSSREQIIHCVDGQSARPRFLLSTQFR